MAHGPRSTPTNVTRYVQPVANIPMLHHAPYLHPPAPELVQLDLQPVQFKVSGVLGILGFTSSHRYSRSHGNRTNVSRPQHYVIKRTHMGVPLFES